MVAENDSSTLAKSLLKETEEMEYWRGKLRQRMSNRSEIKANNIHQSLLWSIIRQENALRKFCAVLKEKKQWKNIFLYMNVYEPKNCYSILNENKKLMLLKMTYRIFSQV